MTYTKPANLFIWVFVFTLLGPLLGLIQMLLVLMLYTASFSPIMLFPFGFVYTMIFLIPAMLTGLFMFVAKDKITHLWSLLLYSLSGSLLTFLWMLLINQFKQNYNQYDSIFTVISFTSTVILAGFFINNSNHQIE